MPRTPREPLSTTTTTNTSDPSSGELHGRRGRLFPLPLFTRRRRRGRRRRLPFASSDMSHFDSSHQHLQEDEDGTEQQQLRGGSFSSPSHRQRRRKRCLTTNHTANQSLKSLLSLSARTWDFNAFTLDRLSEGTSLASLCTHLFHHHGLLRTFRLDPLTVWRFFVKVEAGYVGANPYHNGMHATDVTQAMNLFLQEPLIASSLTPLELMSALIAAATHDLDHPGTNEKFLVANRSHLAALYYSPQRGSLLENHHWRSALSCMHEAGMSEVLSPEEFAEASSLIQSAILATDIARQGEYLCRLSRGIDEGEFGGPLLGREARCFIVQIAMKCADISNPCRTWHISKLWSHRASEEFFRQGDRERELSLPLTPIFDRLSMTVAKIQTGFYRLVASPLFEEWNRLLGSSLSNAMMNNLISNHARWDLLIQQEETSGPPPAVPSPLLSSTTSSSSSSVLPPGGCNSESPRGPSSDPQSDDEEQEEEENAPYPYLPLENHASTSRRRFSLPLEEIRPGTKRRHFLQGFPPAKESFLPLTAAGPVKVPKIFEEDKENSAAYISSNRRRGSAPCDLDALKRRSSFSSLRESSSKPRRFFKLDRRRGSLPVFSPSDLVDHCSCCKKQAGSSTKDPRRKLLRRKSGGSETLLASNLDKAFLRRGSLRLGEYLGGSAGAATLTLSGRNQRHIVVSHETLLDELIKFSASSSSASSGVPPRVQILRGLSPALESELLQQFRTNLALSSSAATPPHPPTSSCPPLKRSPLSASSSNRPKGRRGSLPSELLSFV